MSKLSTEFFGVPEEASESSVDIEQPRPESIVVFPRQLAEVPDVPGIEISQQVRAYDVVRVVIKIAIWVVLQQFLKGNMFRRRGLLPFLKFDLFRGRGLVIVI